MRPAPASSSTPEQRLAVLCEYPTLHGGEHSFLSTVGFVRQVGWDVTVIAPPAGPLAEAVAKRGLRLLPFELHDAGGLRLPRDRLRSRLAQLLSVPAPRLLHANSLSMGRLSGPVADDLRLPSVAHLRDILNLSAAAVADLNRHRRLIAVSHATRDAHVGQGLDAGKTVVIHNGVDLETFRPAQPTGWLHRELRLPDDAVLIGSIGQLIQRKGQDVLAAAAGRLAEEFPQLHYAIVGLCHSIKDEARRYEAQLRAAFTEGPLRGRGHFLGARGDVAGLLPELTMLVHTARQEPLGRVLLEAAAAGVPIIATDVGGTREIFPAADDEAAVIIPPDDPDALAAAIRHLILDPQQRQQRAAAARRRACAAFDAEAAARRLVDLYSQVLATR